MYATMHNEQSLLIWPRFGKYNLALQIPVSWVDLTENSSFPVLDVKDTIDYLARSNNLPKLFGDQPVEGIQSTLLEFWRRYKFERPDFGIYNAALEKKLSLSRSIPVYVHGDEGRGFKRSGVMILSLQGAIGRGSRPFEIKHPLQSLRNIKMGINLAGSSFNSRLLFTAMPKKYYSSKPETWFDLLIFLCPYFFLRFTYSLHKPYLFRSISRSCSTR